MSSRVEPGVGDERREQVQDLRLHGHVEGGGWFVGDQQVRRAGHRHRDHRALPLTTGELVRIGAHDRCRIGQLDAREQLPRGRRGLPPAEPSVDAQRLGDLGTDRHDRIQRRRRLLEDHGQAIATEPTKLRFRQCQQIASPVADLAARRKRRWQQSHHGQRRQRLARAGLADQPDALPCAEREGELVHRRHPAHAHRKVLDGEDRVAHAGAGRRSI